MKMKYATMVTINDELCEVIGNWQSYDNAKKHIDDMMRWVTANREILEQNEYRTFKVKENRYQTREITVMTDCDECISYQIQEIQMGN